MPVEANLCFFANYMFHTDDLIIGFLQNSAYRVLHELLENKFV